jgi:hypothetical protein
MIFVVVKIIRHVVSFDVCHGLKTSFPRTVLEYDPMLIRKWPFSDERYQQSAFRDPQGPEQGRRAFSYQQKT